VIRTRLGLDPLTLFAAVIPASIGLVFTRDLVVPLVFLGIGLALALIVSKVCSRSQGQPVLGVLSAAMISTSREISREGLSVSAISVLFRWADSRRRT
ncbi:MAG: hypothetical protein J0I81_11695, partial [Hyphomicrobium sp.]|nr:hypothetical protein [Hyphomicrobium sp.]